MSEQTTLVPSSNLNTPNKRYVYIAEPIDDTNWGGFFLFIFLFILVILAWSIPTRKVKYTRYEVGRSAYLTPSGQVVITSQT